jgi:hypothetical protein
MQEERATRQSQIGVFLTRYLAACGESQGLSPEFFWRICGTRPRGRPGHALSKPIFPCLQSSCDCPAPAPGLRRNPPAVSIIH